MNKDIAEMWAKALRSGRYIQGRSALKRKIKDEPIKHCCLGVLCELALRERLALRVGVEYEFNGLGYEIRSTYSFNGHKSRLPEAVMDWAFMRSDDGRFKHPDDIPREDTGNPLDYADTLSGMNDLPCSFRMIADYIDKHWEVM